MLRRQRDGLALHHKTCGYPFDTELWVGRIPKAHWPAYEQTAYLIDGAYRCGLLLQDKALMELGGQNIRYQLDHPQPDGKLGPAPADFGAVVGPDGAAGPRRTGFQWPFAVFTRALMAHYGATGDRAILEALTRHYLAAPADFGAAPRDVMNVEGMC